MSTPTVLRPLRSSAGRVLAVLAVVLAGAVVGISPTRAAGTTVVSLTFDDTQASQINALPVLQAHGMVGTFYAESGDIGQGSYYMNWTQVKAIADAGNEIGGHTLHHTDLTTVDVATATAAVCDDRTNLINHGYNPVSFAYPYASVNATAEQVVQSCGYTSGRTVGGTSTRETIPPADPFRVRTPAPADSSTGLQGLQNDVINAENAGGGWAVIVFHGICDNGCTGSSSTTIANFTAFLDWLQARQANGTVVRTVGDVMGAGTPPPPPANSAPATSIACNATACSTTAYPSPVSVTLSAVDPDGDATTTYYTTDGSDPTTSGTRRSYGGAFQVSQTSTVRYYSVDSGGHAEAPKSQTIQVAAPTNSAPATSIRCNGATCSTTAYPSPVSVTLSAVDPDGDATTTYYTTDGSDPTTSGTRRSYAGAFQVSQTSTVRYYSVDSGGHAEAPKSQTIQVAATAGTAPTTSITCNSAACSTGWYRSAPVTARLTATDPDGDATTTYYTTDGSDPRTSATRTTYTGAFSVAETGTVKYYSTDATGLSEATKSQEIRIDAAAPTVSITSPASGSSYSRRSTITVSAAAVDRATGTASASGIARVVFYDGSRTLATVTTPVSGTTTYRFSWRPGSVSTGWHSLTARATDVAGNATTSATVRVYLRR